ncbi:MAG: nucleotidyl transferase AbiEii/AbiGii toxin family protein [Chthoniobacterales bacterium]
MQNLTPVLSAAAELLGLCRSNGWACCLIGGLAVQRWGEPRFTRDADLTLLTGFGGEEVFVRALLAKFQPRVADAESFALKARVLLLRSEHGVDLDVALGALPFEERSIARASDYDFAAGCTLPTCSAEDLVVHKAFAGRERDWADIRGIICRQDGSLDLPLIRRELGPLLAAKNDTESMTKLESMFEG